VLDTDYYQDRLQECLEGMEHTCRAGSLCFTRSLRHRHAMQQANAYYSPQAHGILFGYFRAGKTGQGRNLPGQLVFTCLSQDIIAHEVTHAVIDGIRTYFMEPTNPDVLAFHEGSADLCALFSHFSERAG
jgi:hypothetical protein